MISPRSTYLLRNLGLNSVLNPTKSCVTNTWPSTWLPAPIPITGTLTELVTFFETLAGIFSNTIPKQPNSSKSLASLINIFASFSS